MIARCSRWKRGRSDGEAASARLINPRRLRETDGSKVSAQNSSSQGKTLPPLKSFLRLRASPLGITAVVYSQDPRHSIPAGRPSHQCPPRKHHIVIVVSPGSSPKSTTSRPRSHRDDSPLGPSCRGKRRSSSDSSRFWAHHPPRSKSDWPP